MEASTEPDQLERDRLIVSVRCPKCQQRHDQPVRVVAEASLRVAKWEATPPELICVCPHCSTLAVVAVFPAVSPVATATPRS